jgi:hypothetical protein
MPDHVVGNFWIDSRSVMSRQVDIQKIPRPRPRSSAPLKRSLKHLDIEKIIAEDYASKPEAALDLKVVERTIDRWLEQNAGPPVTLIRNKKFFERRALAEFKRQGERKKGAQR